jgi:hypothetical protein
VLLGCSVCGGWLVGGREGEGEEDEQVSEHVGKGEMTGRAPGLQCVGG